MRLSASRGFCQRMQPTLVLARNLCYAPLLWCGRDKNVSYAQGRHAKLLKAMASSSLNNHVLQGWEHKPLNEVYQMSG